MDLLPAETQLNALPHTTKHVQITHTLTHLGFIQPVQFLEILQSRLGCIHTVTLTRVPLWVPVCGL